MLDFRAPLYPKIAIQYTKYRFHFTIYWQTLVLYRFQWMQYTKILTLWINIQNTETKHQNTTFFSDIQNTIFGGTGPCIKHCILFSDIENTAPLSPDRRSNTHPSKLLTGLLPKPPGGMRSRITWKIQKDRAEWKTGRAQHLLRWWKFRAQAPRGLRTRSRYQLPQRTQHSHWENNSG